LTCDKTMFSMLRQLSGGMRLHLDTHIELLARLHVLHTLLHFKQPYPRHYVICIKYNDSLCLPAKLFSSPCKLFKWQSGLPHYLSPVVECGTTQRPASLFTGPNIHSTKEDQKTLRHILLVRSTNQNVPSLWTSLQGIRCKYKNTLRH